MADVPQQPPKTFTVEAADALLPKIVLLIQQLQALQRSVIETNQQLNELVEKLSHGNGYPLQSIREKIQQLTTHQLQLIEAFQSAIKSLENLGCELKDLNVGLLDFYSFRKDELVYLCWKLGEERIRFWHTLDGGYVGRQPLT